MNESIGAARDSVDEVEKLKEDIGVTDPEMIEKIRRLNQRCKFKQFSIASTIVGVKEASSSDQLLESQSSIEKASTDLGVVDLEWCSKMMEKIRKLDEKCKFEQYSAPSETRKSLASAQSMPSSITTPQHVDASISSSSRKHNSLNSVRVEDDSSDQLLDVLAGTSQSYAANSGNFEYFNSTKEASQKLQRALGDQKSYIIGLHGKRGSGKTALVTADKAEYWKIFDQVLLVTGSGLGNIVDMRNFRGQIATQLKLSFDENISDLERSIKIKSTLENKKKVLVIFDNVSTILFDPRNIGIPDPSKQCKLLWITHDKKNLTMRKCHHLIPLNPLSDEDAWKLLQLNSDIDDDDYSQDDLSNVARQVAYRCKGLPGLIQDAVSSLVKKDSKEYWTELLDSLKHSSARHQIFISFRGADTRDNFTYFLTRALVKEGFNVFKDDEQVRSGDEVSEALTNAIKQSRLSIVVLSENYAQSSWCLGELVQILQCKKDIKQRVLPVFYKVDPSDIRHLRGSFGKGMVGKEERFGKEKAQQWTSALNEIAGLSGKHYRSGPEYEFIRSIVDYVKNNKHCMYII